ncbi:MAG: CHASE3 domain-containing protein [Hyphomicrobiales bacterium]|nr:CHASE3 domain-containing protein [Hyphomicrobiales bacterium]
MSPPPVSFTISPLLWISGLVVLLSGLALLAYFLSRHGSSSSAARIGVLSAVGLLITAVFLYLAINHDQPERVRAKPFALWNAHMKSTLPLSGCCQPSSTRRLANAPLISREPQYVEAWKQAREEVALRMALLRTLVRDRTQQERLTEVERLIGARLEVLDESFQQARTGNVEAAFAIIRAGAGNEIMQGVQSALAEITSGNARLLAQRREAADKERQGLQDRFSAYHRCWHRPLRAIRRNARCPHAAECPYQP